MKKWCFQGMTSLLIGEDGNPIYQKRNWRSYAIYRLEHWGLRYVNNAEVTDDDIFEANQVNKNYSDRSSNLISHLCFLYVF
jgi:leucine-rich repeat-containing protein 49